MALESTQKWVPGVFPGGKGDRYVPQSCAIVTKSGNLNFLEPSGSFLVCNIFLILTLLFSSTNAATNPTNTDNMTAADNCYW